MSSSPTSRFHFLDALRGIAALSVVLHHLCFSSVMATVYEAVSPYFVVALFRAGSHGVEIFFVLSGFVIAHSLRDSPLTLNALGRFVMRRQVRLDPPYWIAMLLGLGALWLRNHVPGTQFQPLPSAGELALNMVYLHQILHLPESAVVLGVAWTLCLEIQFYLLFITILWLCQNTPRSSTSTQVTGVSEVSARTVVVMWVSGLVCLLARHLVVDEKFTYFWTTWHYFAAGVLAYWTINRKTGGFWMASFLSVFALSWGVSLVPTLSLPVYGGTFDHAAAPMGLFVGAVTTMVLWYLGGRNQLGIWKNARLLQYLGRISYSLYLTHMMVAQMVLRLGYKITKTDPIAAYGWMFVSLLLCVFVAHVFYVLVERPSVRWADAISKGKERIAPLSHANQEMIPEPVC